MPSRAAVAALLFVSVAFSGCWGADPSTAPGTGDFCSAYPEPVFHDDASFSGSNAFSHVLALTCDFGRRPPSFAPRVPGEPGHIRAAEHIEATLARHGWAPWSQQFSGAAYELMDHGSAAYYLQAPRCTDADRARMRDLEFRNLFADRGEGERLLYVLAHYDAKREATMDPDVANRSKPVPAANDGASGVGVLLELSRVLAPPQNLTVRLFFTDGEDGFEDCHPLAGSIAHVQNMPDETRDRVVGVLLLDMVGDQDARYCMAGNSDQMRSRLVAAAEAEGVTSVSLAPACSVTDDHTPFVEAGMEAVDLIDFQRPHNPPFPPYWHTTQDTPDKLSPTMLGDVGRVVVRFVQALDADRGSA